MNHTPSRSALASQSLDSVLLIRHRGLTSSASRRIRQLSLQPAPRNAIWSGRLSNRALTKSPHRLAMPPGQLVSEFCSLPHMKRRLMDMHGRGRECRSGGWAAESVHSRVRGPNMGFGQCSVSCQLNGSGPCAHGAASWTAPFSPGGWLCGCWSLPWQDSQRCRRMGKHRSFQEFTDSRSMARAHV